MDTEILMDGNYCRADASISADASTSADVWSENEARYRIWQDLKLLDEKMKKAAKQATKVDRRLQDIRSCLVNVADKMEQTRDHDAKLNLLQVRQLEIQKSADYLELSQAQEI